MFDAENDIVRIISVQLKHVFQIDPSLNHFCHKPIVLFHEFYYDA